jgi:hypothetical protein
MSASEISDATPNGHVEGTETRRYVIEGEAPGGGTVTATFQVRGAWTALERVHLIKHAGDQVRGAPLGSNRPKGWNHPQRREELIEVSAFESLPGGLVVPTAGRYRTRESFDDGNIVETEVTISLQRLDLAAPGSSNFTVDVPDGTPIAFYADDADGKTLAYEWREAEIRPIYDANLASTLRSSLRGASPSGARSTSGAHGMGVGAFFTAISAIVAVVCLVLVVISRYRIWTRGGRG